MSDVTAEAAAPEQTGNPVEAIASMIAANRRNVSKPEGSTPPPAGQVEGQPETPEATPTTEVEPEDSVNETEEATDTGETEEPAEGVSDTVDFLEFAKANPKAIIRIPNKDAEGGFVELPADKAAAILGQGSAIHESARKLKAERADFEEYEQKRKQDIDGLQIGLEMTVVPQLRTVADELVTLQEYNQKWEQIRDSETTPEGKARAEAAMRQNTALIQEKSQYIKENRPKVEWFYQNRAKEVSAELEKARQSFTDKELSNKANFSELRDKLARYWKNANGGFIPGVKNLDLISSDEYLLGLVRDGMKFREGPKVRNAGGSLAAVKNQGSRGKTSPDDKVTELQKKASAGDKNATRDLLSTFIASNRQRRK
jgi:hypothetical protein